jgi:hypothetical protein
VRPNMKYIKSLRHLPASINRSMPFIKILIKAKDNVDKTELLREFPDFVTNDIVEILYNIIMGNISLQSKEHKRLSLYQKPLLRLMNLPNKEKRQKFIYKQKGGFIGAILPVVASLIGGIISNAV